MHLSCYVVPLYSSRRSLTRCFSNATIRKQINLLQNSVWFGKKWSTSKIRAFAYCMAHHTYKRGEYVFRQGEPAQNLCIVYRGKVSARSLQDCRGGDENSTGFMTMNYIALASGSYCVRITLVTEMQPMSAAAPFFTSGRRLWHSPSLPSLISCR